MTRMYLTQGQLEAMFEATGQDQGEERDQTSCLKWRKAAKYEAGFHKGSVTNPYGRYELCWDGERGLYYIQFENRWLMLLPDPETAIPSVLSKLVLEFTLEERLPKRDFADEVPRPAGMYKSGVAVARVTTVQDYGDYTRLIQIRGASVKDVVKLFEMLVDGTPIEQIK